MAIVQAIFEAVFDAETRTPILPRDETTGEFMLFSGNPIEGWNHVFDVPNDSPPTATIRIACDETRMALLKADSSLLWLADADSPVKDASAKASDVAQAVQWLRANGYSGQEFGQAIAAIAQARNRRVLVARIAALKGRTIEDVDRQHIGPKRAAQAQRLPRGRQE